MSLSMAVPPYYFDIVEIVRSADWLVHNFEGEGLDIYNAFDYQYNRQLEGIQYQVILDVNCLQYLLNLTRREKSSELSRIAAAYLTFFQIADIELDPTYATYEKINYMDDRAEEAISNLEQFRGIDNHSLDELAAYALGYEQQLCIKPIPDDRKDLKSQLLRYRRLTDWDSLYLSVLSIVDIAIEKSISRPKKMFAFVNWCISKFRFSLATFVYAAVLFGNYPAKKMMKYKARDSYSRKKAALRNMTWDLYYVDRYMKFWASKSEKNTERFMLTADSGLRLIMQLAVRCQLSGGLTPLRLHLADEVSAVEHAYVSRNSTNRAYKSEEWNSKYRENLIVEYEAKLL